MLLHKSTGFICDLRLVWVLLMIAVYSEVSQAQTNSDQFEYPSWQSIGSAKLTVLWFDIYQAELSSPLGNYEPKQPFKLSLTYLREFSSDSLIKETIKQIENLKQLDQKTWLIKKEIWGNKLKTIWPDVKANDRISFISDKQQHAHFFFNGTFVGSIEDPTFTNQFSAIWLSLNSEYPELGKQLKGN